MPEKLGTRFRIAKSEDASAIAQIFASSWQNAYCGIIPYQKLNSIIQNRDVSWWKKSIARNSNMIIMMFDDKFIGYASIDYARKYSAITPVNKLGEITELYVLPDYQGIGLGKKLFKASWGALKKRGLRDLIVWCLADNHRACEFYRCLGGQKFANDHVVFGDKRLNKLAFKWIANKD